MGVTRLTTYLLLTLSMAACGPMRAPKDSDSVSSSGSSSLLGAQASGSPQTEALRLFISSRLYAGLLERSPDQAGFDFWVTNARLGNVGCAQIVVHFINTPNFQSRQATYRDTVFAFTPLIFRVLLGRNPENAVYQYISIQGFTRSQIVEAVLTSQEFDSLCRNTYGFPGGAGTYSGLVAF